MQKSENYCGSTIDLKTLKSPETPGIRRIATHVRFLHLWVKRLQAAAHQTGTVPVGLSASVGKMPVNKEEKQDSEKQPHIQGGKTYRSGDASYGGSAGQRQGGWCSQRRSTPMPVSMGCVGLAGTRQRGATSERSDQKNWGIRKTNPAAGRKLVLRVMPGLSNSLPHDAKRKSTRCSPEGAKT